MMSLEDRLEKAQKHLQMVYYEIGNLHRIAGEFGNAISSLEMAIEVPTKKKFAQGLIGLGMVYYDMGEYPTALESFKKAIAHSNDDPITLQTALSNAGHTLRKMGNFNEAIAYYSDANNALTGLPYSRGDLGIGISYIELWQYEKAIPFLERAKQIDETSPIIYGYLGFAYLSLGRIDEAIEALEWSYKLNRRDHSALNNLGCAAHEKGNTNLAIKLYSQAIRLNSKDSTSYINRAYAYITKEDFKKAEQDLNAALLLDQNNLSALSFLGSLNRKKGDLLTATALFDKAIELYSNKPVKSIGDYKAAIRAERGLKLEPYLEHMIRVNGSLTPYEIKRIEIF